MEKVDLGIPGLLDYKEIGSGGFATVFSAVEPEANRVVAVKVLAAMDEAGRRRFDRERRTMGQTSAHDNIVTMFRSGYTDPGQRPYLVMEHMPRGSLQDRLDTDGPMSINQAIETMLPVIDGLGFAHTTGIVHKDVKPANILISATGSPKLTDFGIAGIRDTTATNQMAFSLLYTPPETFDARKGPTGDTSDPRDERSDLYSVAATFYTLVTGEPLFWADSQAALMRLILTEQPPPIGDPAVDAFLAVALAKNPDDRFRTAAQFSAAFQATRQQGGTGQAISPVTVTDPVANSYPQTSIVSPSQPSVQPESAGWAPPTGAASIEQTPSTGWTAPPTQTDQPQQLVAPFEAERSYVWERTQPPAKSGKRGTLLVAIGAVVAALALAGGAFALISNNDDGGETPIDTEEVAAPTEETTTSAVQATTAAPTTEAATTTLPEIPEPTVYSGHTDLVWSVIELSDGTIASGSPDNTVQIWDPADPETTLGTYTGHSDRVVTLIELADGRVASSGWDSTVHVWDPADPDAAPAIYTNHGRGIESLAQLPDGRIASASTDETVHIWDPDEPSTTIGIYASHIGPLRSVSVLADGRLASSSDEGTVHVWDADDPDTTDAIYDGHQRGVEVLIGLSDGRIASGSADESVHVWHPSDPDVTLAIYTGHSDRVMDLVELSDGRIASAGIDTTVQIWDPEDPGVTQAVFDGHSANVLSVTELSDRRIASASDDTTVQVWDPADYIE